MGKYDRFSVGVGPSVALEVGYCEGCGGTVYSYELRRCISCNSNIHSGCKEQCEICGADGCRACLIQDQNTLEWRCAEDCS